MKKIITSLENIVRHVEKVPNLEDRLGAVVKRTASYKMKCGYQRTVTACFEHASNAYMCNACALQARSKASFTHN